MRRWILRVAAALGMAALVVFAACRLLLPERFAVNAPLGNLLFGRPADPPDASQVARRLQVPPGLAIGIYAHVPRARWLLPTPTGDLLVSVPREGRVVLLERDADGDGRADGARTLLEGLDRPHGLDLHGGWLYVAEGSAVGRARFDPASRSLGGPLERVVTGLPEGGNHWTRTVAVGSDGWMYVSVGSSCNVCIEEDPRRAALLRFRPDGSEGTIYATGLRNAVGFDWKPGTDELYATDNGRDLLGDDYPPCELNRVVKGGFYGWPFANGARDPDPDLGAGREAAISTSIPPAHAFRAHTAPLGIRFLRHQPAGSAWQGVALVALHGSWNRTEKDGYEVVALRFEEDGSIREERFVWGFLREEDVIGRPVDVAETGDGTVYVSDDYGGTIYRIVPEEGAARSAAPDARDAAPAADAPAPEAAAPADAETLALGRALYETHGCFTCHEAERAGDGVVPVPLAGLAARWDAPALAAFLAAPTPPMPAYDLEERERLALAAHLLAESGSAAP